MTVGKWSSDLFKIIWEEHFKLPWDQQIQQATSFLFNRRGFSYLTEEYDSEKLKNFHPDARKKLPDEFKGEDDISDALIRWSEEGKIEEMFDIIDKKPKEIRTELAFIGLTNQLRKYCLDKKDKDNKKLENVSPWIVERWIKEGVKGLPKPESNKGFNVIDSLEKNNKKITQIPPENKQRYKKLKSDIWNFKPASFTLDKFENIKEGEKIKTHLHHLAFALYKIKTELEEGGRHRKKYFEEVKQILEEKEHNHNYLKTFCKKLHDGKFAPLNVESLANLIGHLSNLELKPLRKYFNDKKDKKDDCWSEDRLNRIFERWILKEWRVNLKKDKNKNKNKNKKKAKGEEQDYEKLKEDWENDQGSVINFFLKNNPIYTIPPYQDNNNRRPPRCQSLILNISFLNEKYPKLEKVV